MDYVFTLNNPPLLKDFGGAVLALPDAVLSEPFGAANWRSVYDQGGDGYTIYVSDFSMTRVRSWVAIPPAVHYAENKKLTVKVVHGYDKMQEEVFAQNLGVQASGNLFDVLDVQVKASLNMTDTTKEQWHEETTEQVETNYEAGTTYLTWKLIDTLHLHRVTTLTGRGWATHRVADNTTTLNNVLQIYEDKDTTANIVSIRNG